MENKGVPGNPNIGNVGDGVGLKPQILHGSNNQAPVENHLGDALWVQSAVAPWPQYYYRGKVNITDLDGPLVLPSAPGAHIHSDA